MDLDIKELRRAIGLLTHIKEQSEQMIRDFFKSLGGDYDTHMMIINEKYFPELIDSDFENKIKISDLPIGTPGLFFKELTFDDIDFNAKFERI